MPRGSVMRSGEVVLKKGAEVRAAETGLLAEIGRTKVNVYGRPRVAVLATGNELVPPGEVPGPGQIRNSNGPLLSAAIRRRGARPVDLAIGRDDEDELQRLVTKGLEADVLVISGGVSAGVLDLVPRVLAAASVEQVFHKVRLKPGKPLWFGVKDDKPTAKIVFGLPGNPVSGLVCFELFVRVAIDRLMGRATAGLAPMRASLTVEHHARGDRPTWWPARLEVIDGEPTVEPLPWRGSADLRTVCQANALVHFPAGDKEYEPGERLEVIRL
jgi:molybdopterin molybdotransferase